MPYSGNASSTAFNVRKARQQLALLKAAYTADHQNLTDLRMWHDERSDRRSVPTDAKWEPAKIGTTWSGRDAYYWLQFDLDVDPQQQERSVVTLNLGRTGDGNNDGFEGLVYINGAIYQAVDSNHEQLFLDPAEFGGHNVISICMWSGLEGGGPKKIQHFAIKTAMVGPEHAAIREAYTYLWNICDLIPELADDNPLKYDYVRLVKNIFRRFFWATEDAVAITQHASEALADIHAFTKEHQGEKLGFDVAAIGQTHIDVAWLWRYRHTAEKATRSFATALQLLREFPDFKFFYSTPQVHKWVEERAPELFKQMQEYAQDGRWEADGATWVEPDTNLPSGEALTRQFLYGSGYFKDKFDAKQTVLWLPDVFGYSDALPQIMRGFGISDFVTSKISWNDTNRAPHDTFKWRGLDGSEVLTYFLTSTESMYDYSQADMFKYTYNAEITPRVVLQSYREYQDKQLNKRLLMPYGFGDGGGGSTREMVENIHVINELPGLPHIRNERVDDFFTNLRQEVKDSGEQYPVWSGELYLEFHRGTYTSQAFVKRANRKLEFALRDLERLATARRVYQGVPYPHAQIRKLWQILLKTQFHDVLPGSAIGEAYEDVRKDIQTMRKGIVALQGMAGGMTLVNPNATLTSGDVTLRDMEDGSFTLAGKPVSALRNGKDYQLLNVPLAPLTSAKLVFTPGELPAPSIKDDVHAISTPHYDIEWNAAGTLTRIYDRDNKREVLAPGEFGNRLTIYEDRPTTFDNWNIDADYTDKAVQLKGQSITVTSNDVATTVDFEYSYHQSTVSQRMIVSNSDRRIDFATTADWHEHELLLRTAFDLNVQTDYATYDIQYGNLRRPINRNTSWDTAKFEVVGHKWADLSQPDYGVALMNDCKYGYAAEDHSLSLSLIKAGTYPDTDADQGQHEFTYSLFPHQGDCITGGVEPAALRLNAQLNVVYQDQELPALFTVTNGEHVEVDAIKISEDDSGVIIRLHDFSGSDQSVTVTPNFTAKTASEVRLDETPVKDLDDPSNVTLAVKPYQVRTLLFKL
ncbi:alpha-mannosidase [Lacticaseibacillus zhaodongensis]|uniref:alpha-mannosidase n=1 Tax=Lacticaseibacillus zhaodongensis TaxID=2668065 RepID=UPI0012D2B99D|nr:glycoside hydrolase family 38 C-terminal domain-containing protein [Lacticaseibacillus zhaodongensis]